MILLMQILIPSCIFLLLRKKISKPNLIHLQKMLKIILRVFCLRKKTPISFTILWHYFGRLCVSFFPLSSFSPKHNGCALQSLIPDRLLASAGVLKPYSGFNNIGIIYPYNNSLLMLWPIIFIRNDDFVGLVQLFATVSIAITIYCLAIELGFPKRNSFISALVILTFPIILLQSITAQNDLLAAAFISAAFISSLIFKKKPWSIFDPISISARSGIRH